MKTILVPTDFSKEADNALVYASDLNKKIKGQIIIYHSYFIPIPASDIPIMIPSEIEIRNETFNSLKKLKNKFLNKYPSMIYGTETSEGYPENNIVAAEKSNKCDLVVMGTRGASGLKEILIGSNTASVIENSICPVIAVPENAKMEGLNKIVFAINYGTDDFKNIFDLIELARIFNSEINLLHFSTDISDQAMENMEITGFKQQVISESNYQNISYKLLQGVDVYHGLNNYLAEIKADILVLNMRNRNLIQKIFHRSITKKIAYHSHIPIMVYHTSVKY